MRILKSVSGFASSPRPQTPSSLLDTKPNLQVHCAPNARPALLADSHPPLSGISVAIARNGCLGRPNVALSTGLSATALHSQRYSNSQKNAKGLRRMLACDSLLSPDACVKRRHARPWPCAEREGESCRPVKTMNLASRQWLLATI